MASTSPTAADTGREGKEGAGPAAEESKSASGSGSAKGPFDDLFSLELSHVRQRLEEIDMDAMMEAGMKALDGDPEELLRMQAAQVKKSAERNRAELERLWDVFDRDHNGVLSRLENRALIKEYLSTSREWLPRLLEETMAVGCEIGTRLATGMTGGSPESAVIAEEVKRNVATMRPKIQAVTLQILEAVDATAFADAALVRMDENGDGKVVREEFMRKFLAVMNDMFNPQQIIQSIQQAMGLLRE